MQVGNSETSNTKLQEPVSPPPDALVLPHPLPSTNNVAELQGLQQAIRWFIPQAEGGGQYTSVVIYPDSTYAMNHVRGITTPRKHTEYVAHVRNDFLRLESLLPTTSFVWHWVKGHSSEISREAREQTS